MSTRLQTYVDYQLEAVGETGFFFTNLKKPSEELQDTESSKVSSKPSCGCFTATANASAFAAMRAPWRTVASWR